MAEHITSRKPLTHRMGRKYQTWRLPSPEDQQRHWQEYIDAQRFYQTVARDGAVVSLGNKAIADTQRALDGDLVALACYGRGR